MMSRKVIAPFLILLYLFAVIGFGFYYCHCKQSKQIALIADNQTCCSHKTLTPNTKEKKCGSFSCQHKAETKNCCESGNGDCCKLVYKSIDIDQEASAQKQNNHLSLSDFTVIVAQQIANPEIKGNVELYTYSKAPPDNLKTALIYHNCQLRL